MSYRKLAPVLVLLSLVLAARPALAQRYTVEEIVIDATVQPGGSVDVRERLTYDFGGRFRFAFREIPLGATDGIDRVRVTESGRDYRQSDSEEPGTFTISEDDDSIRVTWYYQANRERRTFDLEYRIDGQVRRYADVAELYYKFVGEQWDRPVGRVRATVHFPQALARGDVRAWAHGPLHGTVRIQDDGSVALNVSPLPAQQYWEGRILFPPDVVPQLAVAADELRLDAILAEERVWAEEANARREAQAALRAWWNERAGQFLWISVVLAAAGLLAWFFAFTRYGRPHDVYIPSLSGDVPSDHPPALVGFLMSRQVGGRAIVATLLDLAHRGYLSIHETERTSRGWFGERRKLDYRFERTERALAEVRPFERDLVEFLIASSETAGGFTMSSVRRTASKNRRGFHKWFSAWTKQVKAQGASFDFYEPYAAGAMTRNVLVGVAVAAVGVVFCILSRSPAGVPAIAGGIVVAALTPTLNRRTVEGQRLFLAWKAFRAHLASIGRSLGPVSVDSATWGRYLAISIIFGVHKKVLPSLEPVDQGGHAVFPMWFHGSHHHAFGDSMSSLSTSVSSMVTSVSSSMSSAAGTGGGASAGGGGGGGGGGGAG